MIPRAAVQAFAALVFLLFIFVAALILGGCKPSPTADSTGADAVEDFVRDGGLRFVQDRRSGMCFAVGWITDGLSENKHGGAIITWVPCDAQMERP